MMRLDLNDDELKCSVISTLGMQNTVSESEKVPRRVPKMRFFFAPVPKMRFLGF